MNKYIKVCGIILLMISSFYYTEKVALYVQNNTPLKKEIITYKQDNAVEYVNAQINGEYIIPGINGLEVNVDKSYSKMKSYNVFSERYLIYDEVKPEVSVNNFKNKIINLGNARKNAISIIVSRQNKYVSYFNSNSIDYDYVDKTNYCIKLSDSNCSNNNKQIVEPTLVLNNSNFLKRLSEIKKGYIIFINDDLNINYIKTLINYINYNGLNIYKLNKHLSESYQL